VYRILGRRRKIKRRKRRKRVRRRRPLGLEGLGVLYKGGGRLLLFVYFVECLCIGVKKFLGGILGMGFGLGF
jgi:hypothetical protein